MIGLHTIDGGLAVARVLASDSAMAKVDRYTFLDHKDAKSRARALKEWIQSEPGLSGSEVCYVLSSEDFQFLLVESPAVEAAELKEALRWRIKDLCSYDLDEAVIDYIELPEDAFRGRSKMLYVVVMPQKRADEIAALVQGAGLRLGAIDIPELALLNLIRRRDDDGVGTAYLYLGTPHSIIDLTCDQQLYLSRYIDTAPVLLDPEAQEVGGFAEALVLELQRSLDYYESQIGKPPCMRLVLCPLQALESPLLRELGYSLAVELEQLDLTEAFELEASDGPLSSARQRQLLIAMMGALRGLDP